ncbi:MAG: tRNA-specific 2-thiouridylase MnmA [Candidatus Anoxychlamydiales bacterium]|nr:tRNA-specific 2-thiouridylase MnmA [Candidatus Anoxychlamydiales bacterium]NGX35638.1 tRNA-specific 2-thiouridylase MnmA [Candidatus Anoxychlamydiales bacterium]
MNAQKVVAVGLSGGVDSTISAYLLKKQGYKVFGLFMKNWQDDASDCTAKKDFEDVVKTCEKLEIDYYSINFEKEYFEDVFSKCLKDFKFGITPNPDILCNKEIKFKLFLKKAIDLGADFLATGHYAQKSLINENYHLLKGKDLNKDQSYFLYTLKSSILKKVLFPIGDLTKTEVRKIAKEQNFLNHAKKDSTGICFIGKRKFTQFLSKFISSNPGPIKTLDGDIKAEHMGLSFYTIGQRKGLEVGGKGDAWYVAKKDLKTNTLFISQGKNHPSLFSKSLIAHNLTWVVDDFDIKLPMGLKAKVRYRQIEQECTIEKIENDQVHVSFREPQRAITEGQSIVFYQDDICLGGAIILKTF